MERVGIFNITNHCNHWWPPGTTTNIFKLWWISRIRCHDITTNSCIGATYHLHVFYSNSINNWQPLKVGTNWNYISPIIILAGQWGSLSYCTKVSGITNLLYIDSESTYASIGRRGVAITKEGSSFIRSNRQHKASLSSLIPRLPTAKGGGEARHVLPHA